MKGYMDDISSLPAKLKNETIQLNHDQLDTPYRAGGWTVRQVVNHCADSHMHCFTRFKLALTEENPVIKPYEQDPWAELADSTAIAVGPALLMLDGIHQRWVFLLETLSDKQLQRTFVHPEHGREIPLIEVVGLYAWHGNHHLAHITNLKSKRNWH